MRNSKQEKKGNKSRSVARLVAVQTVYRNKFEVSPGPIVGERLGDFQLYDLVESDYVQSIDKKFFVKLMEGFDRENSKIENLLSSAISDYSLERLEMVLAAILQVATCELVACLDIPARVIINEYVDITNTFFDGEQPRLANGVLDHLARQVRPSEFHIAGTS